VTVEFIVDRYGNVTGLRMLSGSGSPFLDQAWFGLFANNTLPPFPPGTKSDTLDITYTIHFELIP
jgi:protein TonB